MFDQDVTRVHEDEIDDEFKPGTGTHNCPKCGTECEVQHNITEYGEFIYCTECRMKFTRKRDPVFENEYETAKKRVVKERKEEKDGYVEFKCYRCNTESIDEDYRTHEKTVVANDFTPIDTGIDGYDESTLTCPCGERHNGYLDIGETIECECGRVFKLSVKD